MPQAASYPEVSARPYLERIGGSASPSRDLVELYARTGDRLETHSTSGSEKKATKKKRKSKDKSESEKSDEFELEHRAEGKTKSEDKKPVGKEDVACTPEEWQRQRERVRKYYTKAARNLHKLMAELER